MKTKTGVFIGLGVGTFIMIVFLLITILADKPWGWFWIPTGIVLVVWAVVGIILLINKLKKQDPVREKLDMSEAEKRVKYAMAYDENNPDNFVIEWSSPATIGKASEPTNVGLFVGYGSENNDNRIAIIDLDDKKTPIAKLTNVDEDTFSERFRTMAAHPEPKETWEETVQQRDAFGNPILKTRLRKPSIEEKEKESEEKAEEANKF